MSADDTYLGLRAFCDELARCGLRHVCTSPGSRSTPLVLSLVRDPQLTATSHLDERCGAFFALGQAKVTGRPVALACTSGTAAANYAPAVIEAHEARVPLIVLTADRPPELRDVGAGQTIDQVRLYGSAAKWFFDVDDHPATAERVRWLRRLACRAYWTALEGRPGPVHLNFALREPLVLDRALPDAEPGGGGRADGRPWVARESSVRAPSPALVGRLSEALASAERPVLVAGRDERGAVAGEKGTASKPGGEHGPVTGAQSSARAIAAFAAAAGIPLLADPLSGARHGRAAVSHYDALLRTPFATGARPDLVLRFGDLPTSKPLRAWLHECPAEQFAFDPESAWQDPAGAVATLIGADPAQTLAALPVPAAERWASWREAWHDADARAGEAIDAALGAELTEPGLAARLGAVLPPEATLFVASSMPVRDLETFLRARDVPHARVLANRGANGIDGTVSTAFGIAAATGEPTVLLTGDVALAHDIGGLLAARRTGARVTIVLVDNDGGGIFAFLPVAREGADYERHVATPHGLDFSHAAALYGLDHAHVDSLDGLERALRDGLASPRSGIVQVRTQRGANLELHRRVWAAVAAHTAGT